MRGIVLWTAKTLGSMALAAPAIWVGSFYIADYVAEKHTSGLTVAVETLSASLTSLNSTVTAINSNLSTQLIEIERERAKLAVEIATEVHKLQGDQGIQARDIRALQSTVDRIESQLLEISVGQRAKFTVDGGKTFKEFDIEDAAAVISEIKGGISSEYMIAPFQVIEFQPNGNRP